MDAIWNAINQILGGFGIPSWLGDGIAWIFSAMVTVADWIGGLFA